MDRLIAYRNALVRQMSEKVRELPRDNFAVRQHLKYADLYKKVAAIAGVAHIPEIQVQSDLINRILNTDYIENAGIDEFEEIRENLRNLMKYIPAGTIKYVTNFADELLSMEWKEAELENDELGNYKAKAEYYIRQHQDNIAIAKLKTNRPLTPTDVAALEEALWHEVLRVSDKYKP